MLKMTLKKSDDNRKIEHFLDRIENFCGLPFTEQIKCLAYIYLKNTKASNFTPKNINDCFELAHLPKPANTSDMCSKLIGKGFIRKGNGYAIHRTHFKNLESEFSEEKPIREVSKTLRRLPPKIADDNENKFLEEAISCYEINAYRAAIIMTWLLTMDHLQKFIINNKLSDFNSALKRQNLKLKEVKVKDDFSELKESKFIEICRSSKIVTNDVRKILDEKLGIRNSCAHPNDIKISESKATSFIEDLVENVIVRYS